jgi:hypothetical protein
MAGEEVSQELRASRMAVAQEILGQLGGASRLRMMLGEKIGFLADTTGDCQRGKLTVNQIPKRSMGGKIDAFTVMLTGEDTYTVAVFTYPSERQRTAAFLRGEDCRAGFEPVEVQEGVYADCLVDVVEDMTGYALQLGVRARAPTTGLRSGPR